MGNSCIELDLSTSRSRPSYTPSLSNMGERINSSPNQNSRTPPNCARCRNHEVILPLKGHKRYCKFMDCKCEKCELTAERQKMTTREIHQESFGEAPDSDVRLSTKASSHSSPLTPAVAFLVTHTSHQGSSNDSFICNHSFVSWF